jgi:uncharacterized protein YukE
MSGNSTTTTTKMVANPMYQALNQLYQSLQRDADTMKNALQKADQQMAGGDTWVGPAARSWGSELDGRSRDCASQVNAMLADVGQALALQPAQVTEKEVAGIRMQMMLMERGY